MPQRSNIPACFFTKPVARPSKPSKNPPKTAKAAHPVSILSCCTCKINQTKEVAIHPLAQISRTVPTLPACPRQRSSGVSPMTSLTKELRSLCHRFRKRIPQLAPCQGEPR
jgi:hypothetical protein